MTLKIEESQSTVLPSHTQQVPVVSAREAAKCCDLVCEANVILLWSLGINLQS